MNTGLISIDLGFLYTKAIVNGKFYMIKSIVGEGKKLLFRNLDMSTGDQFDDLSTYLYNREYFVSDLAIRQSDAVYHSLQEDRFDDVSTEILINTILGLGLGTGEHTANVVSGLPVSHYDSFKDNIKTLCLGNHNYDVTVKGDLNLKGKASIVDGRFLPQPFGAAMDVLLDDSGNLKNPELASQTIAVVDPGFGTTDIYVISSLSPIEKLTFSTPTAMNHAYKLISSKIEENFGIQHPLYAIEEVARSGRYRHHGKYYDMQSVIDWALKSTATQLSSELINKWGNTSEIDKIFLSGGGGIALGQYLIPHFETMSLIPDSQWAVVRGYNKWGKRTWSNVNE